jgi:MFS family permease
MADNKYRQIFRLSSFRNFWLGFTVSNIGDAMTSIALNWYVWEATHSAKALGLLTFFYTAPVIFGGFMAGWLLDRFDRRKVIMADSFLRGAAVLALPILNYYGRLELWHVYLVVGFYGLMMMVSLAGGPSIVPSLVEEEHLDTANALETIGYTLSSVIGPPIAGLLISRISAPNILLIDALSYFIFGLLLIKVVVPKAEPKPGQDKPVNSYKLSDAVRLLTKNKVLLSTTLMYFSINVGMGISSVWLPIYADEVLGGGSDLYGALLGFMAGGQVLSSVLVGGITLSIALGALIVISQISAGLILGLMAADPQVWLAFAALSVFGFLSGPLTIWAQTIRMKIIPAELRGRTFALLRMIMMSGSPLGGLIGGYLLPVIGVIYAILTSSAFITVPGMLGSTVKELRESR